MILAWACPFKWRLICHNMTHVHGNESTFKNHIMSIKSHGTNVAFKHVDYSCCCIGAVGYGFYWESTTPHMQSYISQLNPFEPEFTIVIFIHYKPRITVAILDL